MPRSFPLKALARAMRRPARVGWSLEGGVSRMVWRCYRRWPALARSPLSFPLTLLLARARLKSGRYDGYDDARAADAGTPLRAALRDLREGRRDGAAGFDPAAYLAANPDLRLAGVDPVRHYLARGRFENRDPSIVEVTAERPPLDFRGFVPRPAAHSAVCVIVPVHGARAETLRCIHSLLSAENGTPHRLLVVDDATPDPLLARDLRDLAAAGLIELAVNSANRGFTASANLGLRARRPHEDAVLLNSDTQLFGDWLDRLRRAAYRAPQTGTATPLSNGATILSYPIRLRDNPRPLEIDWAEIDAIARTLGHAPVAIPTAIGFCMYIRGDCLRATGLLDEAAFPRGYGEENDFCLRATAGGWGHVAAVDTFVAHDGAASFGRSRTQLVAQGLAVIDRRYPDYRSAIDAFNRHDPLAPIRHAIDCARVRRAIPDGTLWHWVAARPPQADDGALRLFLDPARDRWRLRTSRAPCTPNINDILVSYEHGVTTGLRSDLGLTHLRLHDPAWLGRRRAEAIRAWARAEGLTVV